MLDTNDQASLCTSGMSQSVFNSIDYPRLDLDDVNLPPNVNVIREEI